MYRLRFTGFLLQPSVSSLVGAILLTLLILVGSSIAYSAQNGFIYELLLGPGSSTALIETSKGVITTFNETVFGNTLLNKVLFFGFWMCVGLVVYMVVTGVGSGISEADKTVQALQYSNLRRSQLQSSLVLRTLLRIIFVVVWVFYGLVFIKIFMPYSILSTRVGLNELSQPSGWFYILSAIVVLMVSLHLHTVLARLVCLRPRVFGGWDVIEESDHKND
jgi:hypothetical protein